MRLCTLVVGVLLLATVAEAQTLDYNLRVYTTATPPVLVSTTPIPNAQVLCNQPSPTSTVTKNPDKVVFDDPLNAGRACIYTDPGSGPLLGPTLKLGNYEGTLSAFVPATSPLVESPESNRAPFSKTPAAPGNVRLIK